MHGCLFGDYKNVNGLDKQSVFCIEGVHLHSCMHIHIINSLGSFVQYIYYNDITTLFSSPNRPNRHLYKKRPVGLV